MIPGPVDLLNSYFVAIGETPGPTEDMWASFLRTQLSDPTGTIVDLENQYLREVLNTTGPTPDLWKAYLDSLGFTGSVDDMAKQALEGDGLLVGPERITNGAFEGVYIAGKAPFWTNSGGITTTEELGKNDGQAQGLTNGSTGMVLEQSISYTNGRRYQLRVQAKRTSGSGAAVARLLSAVIGTSANVLTWTETVFTEKIFDFTSQLTGDSLLRLFGDADALLVIDNASIREILS